jgi:hypothetical protein
MTILDDIVAFAGEIKTLLNLRELPLAGHIGFFAFSNKILTSYYQALEYAKKGDIPLRDPDYTLIVTGVDYQTTSSGGNFKPEFSWNDKTKKDFIKFRAIGGIVLTCDLKYLSQVILSFQVTVDDNEYEVTTNGSKIGLTFVDAKIEIDPNQKVSDAIIQQYNLDASYIRRIEGSLFFGGIATMLSVYLNKSVTVQLEEIFPNFEFSGDLHLELNESREHIIFCNPTGKLIPQIRTCPQDFVIKTTEAKSGGYTESGGTGTGTFQPAWIEANPIDWKKPDEVEEKLGLRERGLGLVGLAIPKPIIDLMFTNAYPAVRFDFDDPGFVGYQGRAIADLSRVQIYLDPQIGRVVVDLEYRTEAFGKVHIDFGKLGKVKIGDFSVEQPRDHNKLQLAFNVVAGVSQIYLKPSIESATAGTYKVSVNVFKIIGGTIFGSVGAVVGFVFDTIIEKTIEPKLGKELKSKIRDYISGKSFPLLDIEKIWDLLNFRRLREPSKAIYNGNASSSPVEEVFYISTKFDVQIGKVTYE